MGLSKELEKDSKLKINRISRKSCKERLFVFHVGSYIYAPLLLEVHRNTSTLENRVEGAYICNPGIPCLGVMS